MRRYLVHVHKLEPIELAAATNRGILDLYLCDISNEMRISNLVRPSTLPGMVLDPDLNTRKFSSKAMVAAARDYNGRTALLEVRTKNNEY